MTQANRDNRIAVSPWGGMVGTDEKRIVCLCWARGVFRLYNEIQWRPSDHPNVNGKRRGLFFIISSVCVYSTRRVMPVGFSFGGVQVQRLPRKAIPSEITRESCRGVTRSAALPRPRGFEGGFCAGERASR